MYVVSKKESRLLTWGPDALGLDPGKNTFVCMHMRKNAL